MNVHGTWHDPLLRPMWIELLEFDFDMGSAIYTVYIIAGSFSQMSWDLKSSVFSLSHEPWTHIHLALAAWHIPFSPRSNPWMRTLSHFLLLLSLFARFVFSGLLWAHRAYTFLQYPLAALSTASCSFLPQNLGRTLPGHTKSNLICETRGRKSIKENGHEGANQA